mmetsp:Transcript_30851/g.80498  ORF Transcript_30851/g.80498 Transcript_30851/m.80498 type:complete len:346 (-) Transcript_30851:924-1961(-)
MWTRAQSDTTVTVVLSLLAARACRPFSPNSPRFSPARGPMLSRLALRRPSSRSSTQTALPRRFSRATLSTTSSARSRSSCIHTAFVASVPIRRPTPPSSSATTPSQGCRVNSQNGFAAVALSASGQCRRATRSPRLHRSCCMICSKSTKVCASLHRSSSRPRQRTPSSCARFFRSSSLVACLLRNRRRTSQHSHQPRRLRRRRLALVVQPWGVLHLPHLPTSSPRRAPTQGPLRPRARALAPVASGRRPTDRPWKCQWSEVTGRLHRQARPLCHPLRKVSSALTSPPRRPPASLCRARVATSAGSYRRACPATPCKPISTPSRARLLRTRSTRGPSNATKPTRPT